MGWETRKRGGRYYVQKVRIGGRVTSRYLGSGETAGLIAQMQEFDRSQREDDRAYWQWQRKQLETEEAENIAFFAEVETVLRQALAAAGYHQHKRGEWRKRRDKVGNRGRGREEQGEGRRQAATA